MHENPSFVVCQTQISKSNAGRGEEEVNGEVVTQTDNYEGKLAGEHTQCCQLTEEAMRWTKKHLGGQAGKSKWQAERERRKSTVDAGRQTIAHRRSISQTESSSNIHVLMREAKQAVLSTRRGGPASEVVALQGASDLPWRWSVNANFNAASSELPGAALPGGFKGCSGSQISVICLPDSLIFKNILDFSQKRSSDQILPQVSKHFR